MKLLEREVYLDSIQVLFNQLSPTAGHTLFITGEAGIGKTSLLKAFIRKVESLAQVLTGTCDSLFTPRPLGPLFDISIGLSREFQQALRSKTNRPDLFSEFLKELKGRIKPTIIVFEDIHWADEATLDLIKYLTRRIDQVNCLFILTYRDDEVTAEHPLRKIHGDMPVNLVTKIKINRLSIEAVRELSSGTGFNAENVYQLTGGNPFYVTEILAFYSNGIPENIKDSILNVFYRQKGRVRELWELISVVPGRIDIKLLELIAPDLHASLDTCLRSGILRMEDKYLLFKHELYRKTIEEALNPYQRILLNEKILDILLLNRESITDLTYIVHHAKNANKSLIVAEFAPLAAKNAAVHGAHIEAVKLYMTAIQYFSSNGKPKAELLEQHAYECYLTNQIHSAIDSQKQALVVWKSLDDRIKIGASQRFLSRLYWFEGDNEKAESYALAAIGELEKSAHLQERAKAYSNYSQLKMLAGENEKALEFGQKAVELSNRINDEEILSHALNNIGSALYHSIGSLPEQLNQSLEIALRNGYHEHVARAYTNIAANAIDYRYYDEGIKALTLGIEYCLERDLDSWVYYMLSWKARFHFEKCEWEDAESIARKIIEYPSHPVVVRIGSLIILGRLLIRKGEPKGIVYLEEAMDLALKTREMQRIIPVTIALLEYGWLINNPGQAEGILETALGLLNEMFHVNYYSQLVYWMQKNNLKIDRSKNTTEPFRSSISGNWQKAAGNWQKLGCLYEYALELFEGPQEHQREALKVLDRLGATGTAESLKLKLRSRGFRNIPRGPRLTTRNNPANLTQRQVDVLHLLRTGLQNTEIAEKLFISSKTVDHHITAILSKLNVNSRIKAVNEAEKLGIIK